MPSVGAMAGGLDDRHRAFIEFLLDPNPQRMSLNAYAREIGVARGTLDNWRRAIPFRRALEARAAELNVDPVRVQDVVEALWRNARNGDVRSAELYLRYVDRLMPQKVVIVDKGVAGLSDDELDEQLRALVASEGAASSDG